MEDAVKLDRLLDVRQVASCLGLSRWTIRRMCRLGKIPAIRINNQWRFHPHEIDRWLGDNGKRAAR
jgi:excisionase family DNA binding protein